MWWENKLFRTLRCRLKQKPGVLGHLLAAVGKSMNNILGFPGIFRGAVDANVRQISCEMLLAAAHAIAESASPGARVALDQGLNRDDLTGYFD